MLRDCGISWVSSPIFNICLSTHQDPSEKGSGTEGKNLLLQEKTPY